MTNTAIERQLDDKAARMLEIYAEQRFRSSYSAQRLRFTITRWVIRVKIVHQLKRILDMIFASLLIAFTAPIMLITAIAIKLDSPGPVIFRQTRVGKWGVPFTCFKFRSMYVDAETRKEQLMALNEASGPVFKMKRDPRVTRVGRVIRKLSIDELPQFFNVLRGEMSMVGPRPPVPKEVSQYSFDELRRLEAVPGITGLQQVSGRSDMSFKRWIELDMQYIAEQSLLKDIEILLKTIPAVMSGKGAY
ncbi:MAG: exopolysaccharide biosynthesis polyprenyl glycosylphosphotransferase [Chloroflexi bacterium]|nr:exopolysaccharide biosynthesis polyprenyl glycosylphosphotransferase [Chloroflexota bacterium]